MLITPWYKLTVEKLFLIIDWLRCNQRRLKNNDVSEGNVWYESDDWIFYNLLYEHELLVENGALPIIFYNEINNEYTSALDLFSDNLPPATSRKRRGVVRGWDGEWAPLGEHYTLVVLDFLYRAVIYNYWSNYHFIEIGCNARTIANRSGLPWGEWLSINSLVNQLIVIGQILEFGETKSIFLHVWGGGSVGYINASFWPVYIHHICLTCYSYFFFEYRIRKYLVQRFDILWQLIGRVYDDLVFMDATCLFSSKNKFIKFLFFFLRRTPNYKYIILRKRIPEPKGIPRELYHHFQFNKQLVFIDDSWHYKTHFNPLKTFINSDLLHPDSFALIKFWYFPWSTVFFSLDDEILCRKLFPYNKGVTDSVDFNKPLIKKYFLQSVNLKLPWTRRRGNIFRQSVDDLLARSIPRTGFLMLHIVWYNNKWDIIGNNYSFSFEKD